MTDPGADVRGGGSAPLDTTLVVLTPENVAFQFRLAGPARRALAFLIDALVIGAVGMAIILAASVLDLFGESVVGLVLVALFFLWWGYGAACEAINNGQTLGKSALGLRVVARSGLSINAAQAVLRNLIRLVDVAPPFFPGVVAMAVSPRFERLGDLAAGTIVVLDGTRRHVAPPLPATGEPAWVGEVVPPAFVPAPPLAEALAAYVDRRPLLSPGRRAELAGIVAARLCAAWEAPPPPDADALVCALYGRAVAATGAST